MSPLSQLDQWRNDVYVYNEEYETLYLTIKEQVNDAFKFMRGAIPFPDVTDTVTKLAKSNIRLSELAATAGELSRDITHAYGITRRQHIARLVEEKKIAEEVAELEADMLMSDEFNVMNETDYNLERTEKLWKSTDTLILSLLTKLSYESKTNKSSGGI